MSCFASIECPTGQILPGVVPVLPTLQALLPLLVIAIVSAVGIVLSLLRPHTARRVLHLLWCQKIPLGLATIVTISLIWGAARVGRRQIRSSPPETIVEAWPVHRGGLDRCGALPRQAGPKRGGLVWSTGRRGESFYSSAAVSGERVYIVGSKGNQGRIYCFDVHSGERIWSVAPRGFQATFSSPVIADRRLVCGEGLHYTRAARVFCIDLRPGREGNVVWAFRTNSHVECTPVIEDGRVYVGAGDDGIYCLDLEPDSQGRARVLWHVPPARYPDAETSLAVHRGRVYAGLGIGGRALCVLDARDGRELKRISTPYPVFGPPSIASGKLYLGMGVGDYVTPDQELAGQVCCIDLESHQIDWTFPCGGTVLGCVAISRRELIFGCSDGQVYCLSEDGRLKTRWNTYAPIVGSPAVTSDSVYVVNQAGILLGLDRRRFEPIWEYRFDAPGRYTSSPVVSRDSILVGTETNGFVRVGRAREQFAGTEWPGRLGGPGVSGCRDGSLLPLHPRVGWCFPVDDSGDVVAPVAVAGEMVVIPMATGPQRGIACVEATGGHPGKARLIWQHRIANGVWQSPAVVKDQVLAVDGRPGDSGRRLTCIDCRTGGLRWRFGVDAEAPGCFLADDRGVLLRGTPGSVSLVDLSGKLRWSRELGAAQISMSGKMAMAVAAVASPSSLIAIDCLTGRDLWRAPLTHAALAPPIIERDRVYVGTSSGLLVCSLADGSVLSSTSPDVGGVASEIRVDAQLLRFVNTANEFVSIHRKDGICLDRHPNADPQSNLIVAGPTVLYVSQGKLWSVQTGNDTLPPQLWFDLATIGSLSSPMVLHAGQLYFGVAGRGLVCLARGSPG
jgi:outer membrane protein assembly factor BamB